MTKRMPVLLSLVLSAGISVSAQASSHVPPACLGTAAVGGGAGGGNGGSREEIDFKANLLIIDRFLHSKLGAEAFPEVNPEDFHQVALGVKVFMKTVNTPEEAVRDEQGNLRTCVWNRAKCLITCDVKEHALVLAGKKNTLLGIENGPGLPFVIDGHEQLALMNHESGDSDSPSAYWLSLRFLKYGREVVTNGLETGDSTYKPTFREQGFNCVDRSDGESFLGLRKKIALQVSSEGEATLWEIHSPLNSGWYFAQQCEAKDPKDKECKRWERKRRNLVRIGMAPRRKKIATGLMATTHGDSSDDYSIELVRTGEKSGERLKVQFGESLDRVVDYKNFGARNSATIYRMSKTSTFEQSEEMTLKCFLGPSIEGEEGGYNLKMNKGKIIAEDGEEF